MIVRQSVTISTSLEDAFELFTDGIHQWWPINRFSYGGERAQAIFLERQVGGRFYERFIDGDELQVGEVLECDPPSRILFTWTAPGWNASTDVEVTFSEVADGTHVKVEHRGFERLGPEGDDMRDMFGGGWPGCLASYAAKAKQA